MKIVVGIKSRSFKAVINVTVSAWIMDMHGSIMSVSSKVLKGLNCSLKPEIAKIFISNYLWHSNMGVLSQNSGFSEFLNAIRSHKN